MQPSLPRIVADKPVDFLMCTLVALILASTLAACGGESSNSGAGLIDGGSTDVGDVGDVEDAEDAPETGDAERDVEEESCEWEDFDMLGPAAIEEYPEFWSLRAFSRDRRYTISIGIYQQELAEGDVIDFGEGEDGDYDHVFVVEPPCASGDSCDTFYAARAGTLEVVSWSETDNPYSPSRFEGRFADLEFVEGTLDAAGQFRPTWAGDTGCVAQAEVSASIDAMQDFNPSCDNTGFVPDEQKYRASFFHDAQGGTLMAWANTAGDVEHHLELWIRRPRRQSYELNDFRLEHCEACLFLYEDCSSETSNCRTYAAGAGTLEVTEYSGVGGRFRATATGVEMAEASVDPFSGQSRLIEGGAGWCIDRIEWDVVVGSSGE